MRYFIILMLITLNSVFAQLNIGTLQKYRNDLLKLNDEFNNYYSVLVNEKQTSSITLSVMYVMADKYNLIDSYIDQLWLIKTTDSYDLNTKDKKHFQNLKPEMFKHIKIRMAIIRESFLNERSIMDNKCIVENFDKMIKWIDNFLKIIEAEKK